MSLKCAFGVYFKSTTKLDINQRYFYRSLSALRTSQNERKFLGREGSPNKLEEVKLEGEVSETDSLPYSTVLVQYCSGFLPVNAHVMIFYI